MAGKMPLAVLVPTGQQDSAQEPVERASGFRTRSASYRSVPPSNPTGSWAESFYAFGIFSYDPFDRILLAQSISDALVLVTADPEVAGYPAAPRPILGSIDNEP
jgi:hypothetical protein